MYNSEDVKMKFEILINEAFDWLIDVITNVDDINDVMTRIDKFIDQCKYKSFKVRTFSRQKYE